MLKTFCFGKKWGSYWNSYLIRLLAQQECKIVMTQSWGLSTYWGSKNRWTAQALVTSWPLCGGRYRILIETELVPPEFVCMSVSLCLLSLLLYMCLSRWFMSLYTCLFTWMWACEYACVWMYVEAWGWLLGNFFSHPLLYSLSHSLPVETGALWSDSSSQLASRICLDLLQASCRATQF